MFCTPLSVRPFVRQCVNASDTIIMFPRYLQYSLTDLRQTFVIDASWDKDELI